VRILRDAEGAAGSKQLLRDAVTGQLAALSLSVGPGDVEEVVPAALGRHRWRPSMPGTALAAAGLAAVLLVMATAPAPHPAEVAAPASARPAEPVKGPPLVVAEPGVLPTLESCGIGPPDAPLAYAGWLTVEELGAAPPDAGPGDRFYALVPEGDVAWNPPGLSRRVTPPVRGRLACLSTVSGQPPTVVGLPAGWSPPPVFDPDPIATPTLADCDMRPDAPLAYTGWLTAEQLTGERSPRPVYALVTERRRDRVACVLDPDAGVVERIAIRAGWEPPRMVDGCPASPVQRFAGNLEAGGPDAFVLLPPLSTSAWVHDPSVRIMARLSPGPGWDSVVTATARQLGPGGTAALRVAYTPTPVDRVPSKVHYVWLEDVLFPQAGCWIVALAIDDRPVGWAVLPVRQRPG
jgi:hypothetical protein